MATKIAEWLMNQVSLFDPNCLSQLVQHSGKVIQISITDLLVTFYIILRPEKIYIYSNYSDSPDTIIEGSSFSLLRQMLASSQISNLKITGDIELAQDVQSFLKQQKIEWEEYISYILGDFATHQVAKTLRGMQKSFLTHQKRGLEDITDYLQEEKRLLPPAEEIEDFYEEIASLRNAVDRLEAKLQRLTESK